MVKRKDAVANREKLIVAGFEILAKRDADLSVRELALHANLGIGTAYRHFPTHEDLIRALYDRGASMFGEMLQPKAEEDSGWDALVAHLERAVFMLSESPGLRTVMRRMYDIDPEYRPASAYSSALAQIISDAQAEGSLRAGITGSDIGLMVFSLGGMVGNPNEIESNLLRRQIVILLDGMRADGPCTPLPEEPMGDADFHAFVHRSNAPHA